MNSVYKPDPLISVIIPYYNNMETIELTIKSVLKQTYPHFEILLVDDGSDTIINPIISRINDPRLFYHKLEHNNANVARNYGINLSKGEYIAMLDADDQWMNNHLEDCLNSIRKLKCTGLYGSLLIKSNGQYRTINATIPDKTESMVNYLLRTGYGAQTSTLFMTSASAKKILFDPTLNRHQDYDFVVRYNKQFLILPKTDPTVVYLSFQANSKIDFHSCIAFIKQNKKDINPMIYNKYHLNMLNLALKVSAHPDIIRHYRKEATNYVKNISYAEYIIIKNSSNRIIKLRDKLNYLIHIL